CVIGGPSSSGASGRPICPCTVVGAPGSRPGRGRGREHKTGGGGSQRGRPPSGSAGVRDGGRVADRGGGGPDHLLEETQLFLPSAPPGPLQPAGQEQGRGGAGQVHR